MRGISLLDGPVDLVGALDCEVSATGLSPRRLPAWTRPQIPDLFMDFVVQMPSGVRLRFRTSSSVVELEVLLTQLRVGPNELQPSAFDLVVDGRSAGQVRTTTGNVLNIDLMRPDDVVLDVGEPATIRYDGLGDGMKDIEIWLPQAATVELRALRIDDGAVIEPAPPPQGRRWVHYGSSISHCLEAASPTQTWPAVAARAAEVELISLGFGGQCMLDQFVARTVRDLEPDVISLKVGINVVNGDTMRERAFGPALHGFLDTIRERLPNTPILVVSPIYCPPAEDKPGPTIPGPNGKFTVVDGLDALRSTCLTLEKVRAAIAQIVGARRDAGDTNLHYLDGLELFGPDDVADLPDHLHPNAAGYVRMGDRFAALGFGAGPLGSAA
jgi:hypothetical protein